MSAGKGDKPRPVDKKKYDSNYNSIHWDKKNTLTTISSKTSKKTYVYKSK